MTKEKFRAMLRQLVRELEVVQDPAVPKKQGQAAGRKAAKLIKDLMDWYDKEFDE